jgi:hypothetical protein
MDADLKAQLLEASQQVRNALRDLRESVVQLVMRRNALQDQLTKVERQIAADDLETKAALAEKINNPGLAAELRQELKRRQEEAERLRNLLAVAETDADAAKARLPEDEARLTQQAHEIKARLAAMIGDRLEANAEGEATWARAADKVRGLQSEASAREEVAGRAPASGSAPHTPA